MYGVVYVFVVRMKEKWLGTYKIYGLISVNISRHKLVTAVRVVVSVCLLLPICQVGINRY